MSFDAGVVLNTVLPTDTNAAFSVQFVVGTWRGHGGALGGRGVA